MHAYRTPFSGSRYNPAPVTTALIAGIAAAFLVGYLSMSASILSNLRFSPDLVLERPWSLVTYPFSQGGGLIGVFFICMWFWGIGTSLEREFGRARYLGFWIAMTVLGALFHWLGYWIVGTPPGSSSLVGPYLPVAAMTVAWGTRNPNAPVLLMFVLPLQGRWVAVLAVLLVFFGTIPQLALFAIATLLVAYLYAANRLPHAPAIRRQEYVGRTVVDKNPYEKIDDAMRRQKDREERDRLRKLFEGSLREEDPDKK